MEAGLVNKMFSSIAGRYDVTNSVLSMGIHHLWRSKLVQMLPADSAGNVMDLCTGTGDLLPILRSRFGKALGVDFCRPMLEVAAKKEAAVSKINPLIQADALNLPFADATFDIVTVAFGVRNFENLERGLCEIARILKPGAHLLVLEFGQPQIIGLASLYNLYSKHLMPLIGGLLTGNKEAYTYLPRTASQFPCRENFVDIMNQNGFTKTKFKTLSGGIAYAYCGTRAAN